MPYPLVLLSLTVPRERPDDVFRFSYGSGKGPKRMRYFNPLAYVDLLRCGPIVLTDMARSPEAQLRARISRKGSQTVAEGGHIKLVCVDLDVRASMRALGLVTKRQLDAHMAERNFHCHRRDGLMKMEAWHYNWIPNFDQWYQGERRTNDAMQRFVDAMYGAGYELAEDEVELAMHDLELSDVRSAQHTYGLKADGIAGPVTQKTLAIAAARFTDGHGRFAWPETQNTPAV